MVRAIIFDCFGVLTTDLWKEFLATLPANRLEGARYLNYQYDAGILDRDGFVKEIIALTGRNAAELNKVFAGDSSKNFELLKFISTLKKDYKIGLLSNVGSNWIREDFLTKLEQNLFDAMILSFEVHLAKPDPEIFELTAERLGVKPSESVLVDDSEGHCAAAAAQGMKTVVYQNFQQMKGDLKPLLAA